MKKVGKPVFLIVSIMIVVLTLLAFFGASYTFGDTTHKYVKSTDDIRWGIDIRGGVDVTFTPSDGRDATPDEMKAAESIIKVRLVSQGITDSEVYTDTSKDRIIVRFPWKADETNFNPEEAVKELGETAMLTFREGSTFEGPVVLEGAHIESAQVKYNSQDNEYVVELNLKSEGQKRFSEATARLVGGTISIWMDENLISAPSVKQVITDSSAIISGNSAAGGFTVEEATDLANKINGGALPFKLTTENFSTISPTLGNSARDAMVTAGMIAFVLVAVFIILVYRMCGVVASIALLGQVAGMIACLTGFFGNFPSFTLTLPGIAGIILSIGMGVDANVITSERIKEELRAGKTLDGAIDSGFQRTFSAIFDGNITMVIVAMILMGAFGPPDSVFGKTFGFIFSWFGSSATGAIYSFGFTLIAGVILNFVMGVTASRLMLKSVSKFKIFQNRWLYGDVKGGTQKLNDDSKTKSWFDVVGRRKIFFSISCAFIVIAAVATVFPGPQLDVQFSGGTIINYSYEGTIDQNDFKQTVEQATSQQVAVREQSDVSTGKTNYVVTFSSKTGITPELQIALNAAIAEKYPENQVTDVSISNVNPVIGRDFLLKSLVAVAFAALLMIAYIGFRFRKMNGISAGVISVLALLHDLVVVYAAFILCRFPLNDSFIAVLLTILGYSINNTIIIYDRIRENRRLMPAKTTFRDLVNASIGQSMTRSINTTISTVLAMLVVCVMSVMFSVQSIITFAFPLLVGMLAGFFSSVFISGPLWGWWQERKQGQNK